MAINDAETSEAAEDKDDAEDEPKPSEKEEEAEETKYVHHRQQFCTNCKLVHSLNENN